jgi:hypothetical protein
MIHSRLQLGISACGLQVLCLRGCHVDTALARGRFLLGIWTSGNTTSPVEADAVHRSPIDHRGVVHIVNVGDVHVVHRAIVVEVAIAPVPALVAVAEVAITVINAAVEADDRSPKARVPDVGAIGEGPVSGSPQKAGFGREHPRTRNPVISFVVVPGPVSRRPDVPFAWAEGLLVSRQLGRSEAHGDQDLAKGCAGQEDSKQERQKRTFDSHAIPLLVSGPVARPGHVTDIGMKLVLVPLVSRIHLRACANRHTRTIGGRRESLCLGAVGKEVERLEIFAAIPCACRLRKPKGLHPFCTFR